jgi:uncharacterized protein with NRDE domain
MCLILFALEAHPDFRLLVAANRDEHFARPTAPAAFWTDAPQVLAGRDLDKGGTWFGVDTRGRFAAVTNFRGAPPVPGGPSRGALAVDFLKGSLSPADFIDRLAPDAAGYQGFNLLLGDARSMRYYSNRLDAPPGGGLAVASGVHGLSNHLLDTPWPKVERGRRALEAALPLDAAAREHRLLAALSDREPPADELLESQGAPIAFERALAAPFIHAPDRDYGTRCSTLLSIGYDGTVRLVEHTWDRQGRPAGDAIHHFQLS